MILFRFIFEKNVPRLHPCCNKVSSEIPRRTSSCNPSNPPSITKTLKDPSQDYSFVFTRIPSDCGTVAYSLSVDRPAAWITLDEANSQFTVDPSALVFNDIGLYTATVTGVVTDPGGGSLTAEYTVEIRIEGCPLLSAFTCTTPATINNPA